MTQDKAVSDLVNRYLFAIGEDLPRTLGADVTRELRTLIEDKLEDRAQTLGKPIDTALATYVLREIGEPCEVARRYHLSPQYLVGPRFYPAFIRFARIGLVGLAIMLLLTTVLTHAHSPEGARTLFSLTTVARLRRPSSVARFAAVCRSIRAAHRAADPPVPPHPGANNRAGRSLETTVMEPGLDPVVGWRMP